MAHRQGFATTPPTPEERRKDIIALLDRAKALAVAETSIAVIVLVDIAGSTGGNDLKFRSFATGSTERIEQILSVCSSEVLTRFHQYNSHNGAPGK